ncbi:MAG: Photosynthesis system assembly factor [Chloroflexota bacterium]|jgi:photosystem II stability/assembly factor-like uncharacterized protein
MPSPELLIVGTADGLVIYRVVRGALTPVSHTLAGRAVSAISAADALALVVAADGGSPLQSFDGGATWAEARGAAPEPMGARVATVYGPADLAYPRLTGATAYARLRTRPPSLIGAGAGGVMLFRSEDDGIHWKPAALPPQPFGRVAAIAPSAASPRTAWAGADTGALLRTLDAGARWEEAARAPAAVLCLVSLTEDESAGGL